MESSLDFVQVLHDTEKISYHPILYQRSLQQVLYLLSTASLNRIAMMSMVQADGLPNPALQHSLHTATLLLQLPLKVIFSSYGYKYAVQSLHTSFLQRQKVLGKVNKHQMPLDESNKIELP